MKLCVPQLNFIFFFLNLTTIVRAILMRILLQGDLIFNPFGADDNCFMWLESKTLYLSWCYCNIVTVTVGMESPRMLIVPYWYCTINNVTFLFSNHLHYNLLPLIFSFNPNCQPSNISARTFIRSCPKTTGPSLT